jgi:hypothetical protein
LDQVPACLAAFRDAITDDVEYVIKAMGELS